MRFDAFTVAMGCVLLASKIEENSKILREVIYAFHQIYNRRRGLAQIRMELGSQRYNTWKNGETSDIFLE